MLILELSASPMRPEIKSLMNFGVRLLMWLALALMISLFLPIPSGIDSETGKTVTHTPLEYLLLVWKLARITALTLILYLVSALIALLLVNYKANLFAEPKRSQLNSGFLALLAIPGVLYDPDGLRCAIMPIVFSFLMNPFMSFIHSVPFLVGWIIIFTCFVVWRWCHPLSQDDEFSRA